MAIGVPDFDNQGRYLGPLPENLATRVRPIGKEEVVRLIGKEEGKFRTASAADWPPQLCECLTKFISEHLETWDPMMKSGRQGEGPTTGQKRDCRGAT